MTPAVCSVAPGSGLRSRGACSDLPALVSGLRHLQTPALGTKALEGLRGCALRHRPVGHSTASRLQAPLGARRPVNARLAPSAF
ncbi:hypothetical protein GUJ93_ZPchr0015g6758 [Zizania palustris]|uniref:Uncharacterized protein n=1 Tax=Zizania palustris TaxID=103762 RepID=A0A8J5W716_ZIZPA|nr:hypothetical protein GUJ93_ZPchr0015g6758 [Zizania palustris]